MTLLHLVGLENSGHHLWFPTIENLAHHCGRKFVQEHDNIEHMSQRQDEKAVKSQLRNGGQEVLIFWNSFPSNWSERRDTLSQLKNSKIYNIAWDLQVVDELKRDENITVIPRYLYLDRDRFDMMAGKCDLDYPPVEGQSCIHTHTIVMQKFLALIGHVFESIKSNHPGIWTSINMDWLHVPKQCEAMFRDLVTFLAWDIDRCDLAAACAAVDLPAPKFSALNKEPNLASICADLNFVEDQMSSVKEIADIPVLGGQRRFKSYDETKLSERKAFCESLP